MMNKIQFWLSYNNGAERLQLPVNPANISVSSPHGFEDINVSQLGEYTIIGESRLKEFAFSSFFPRDYNESYCEYSDLPSPWEAIQSLERWRDSRNPIRLIITGTPINYAVTLRDFSYDAERAGNVGDIYFNMTLKEFRFVQTRKVTVGVKAKPQATDSRPSSKSNPKTYTVKSGDTLYKIAMRVGIGGNNWRKLYEENVKIIGKNPNLIKPGQKLVIPNG